MNKLISLNVRRPIIVTALALALVACGNDDNDPVNMVEPEPTPEPTPVTYSYEVTIQNLTNAQPVSPVAVVLHNEGTLWEVGAAASTALELMAEGGDNSELLALANVLSSASGSAPIGPGASESITVSIDDNAESKLSVATMLVNTNDAFTGWSSLDLSAMAVGDSWTGMGKVYDAGTEMNSEAMGTMPGPADGGEGYNVMRDDVDFVSGHPGVVGMEDGLTASVLTQAHRFDNPAIKITVMRTQ